jgi:hypothetical protein
MNQQPPQITNTPTTLNQGPPHTTLPHKTLKQADFLHSFTAAAATKFLHVLMITTRRLITVLGRAATLLVAQ